MKKINEYVNGDDEPVGRIAAIYTFANGSHMVFDERGKQIPELQQAAALADAERLADTNTAIRRNVQWGRP